MSTHDAGVTLDPARPGKVLIIDDDEVLCEVMELTLAREGLVIAWRSSVEEALALLVVNDFDVVIMDMTMPGMSGVELCERVRTLYPDLPVVMLSGHATIEAAASARRAGAFDYVVKPVNAKVLAVSIDSAVRHRRSLKTPH